MMEATMKKENETKNEEVKQDQKDTKQVYINSFEAADLYNNQYRQIELKSDYCGMIPYSLELIKLRQQKDFNVKLWGGKEYSDDVINVRFKRKTEDISKSKKSDITDDKINEELNNLKDEIAELKIKVKLTQDKSKKKEIRKQIKDDKKDLIKMTTDNLRELLYLEGFDYNNIHYVHYKRSAAKSRQGQCLFIREDLYDEMINWSRMNIDFPQNEPIDLARLLSAECLVSTSIEKTIKINPHHILLINDIERPIYTTANVIEKDDIEGHLVSNLKENVKIDNCLTDGEALLDSSLFEDRRSMMLLRHHFFKAAAFSTNFKKFFEDYPVVKVKNMFNEPMDTKDIELVITPSCLKALKFYKVFDEDKNIGEQKMFHYWIKQVEAEDSEFGVCKHEKESKYHDEMGNPIQRTSYQMINSLDADKDVINELCQWEINYIMQMKNNDDAFLTYLKETQNNMNANEMMLELVNKNEKFTGTKLFRDYRAHKINEYVATMRKGKIKLSGDYCVLFGNPLTYIFSIIGEKPKQELIGNECYCKLFESGEKMAAFRNPHTAPSNIVVLKNNRNINEMKYFNLSDNVVVVNADRFPIQRHLSGCDYDSDSAVLFNTKKLVEIAEKSFGIYPVCVNGVKGETTEYKLSLEDDYKIDSKLKGSQQTIGEVVNVCQQVMSKYWDKGGKDEELLKAVNVATVLSEIAIDLAKKYYDIKFKSEINYLKSLTYDKLSKKVLDNEKEIEKIDTRISIFWKYIKKDIKDSDIKDMNTPMDYLEMVINGISKGDNHETAELKVFLIDSKDKKKANRKQINEIINKIAEQQKNVAIILNDKDLSDKTKTIKRVRETEKARHYVAKLKIKDGTFETILYRIATGNKKIKNPCAVLNVMYQTHKKKFLEFFR